MGQTRFFLNDSLVTLQGPSSLIKTLEEDDAYFGDFVRAQVIQGAYHPYVTAPNAIVRRVTAVLHTIWRRTRSPHDRVATELLLRLFHSEKYTTLFSNRKMRRGKVWQKIAREMRREGYYVTGPKCAKKLSNLKRAVKIRARKAAVRAVEQKAQEEEAIEAEEMEIEEVTMDEELEYDNVDIIMVEEDGKDDIVIEKEDDLTMEVEGDDTMGIDLQNDRLAKLWGLVEKYIELRKLHLKQRQKISALKEQETV